MQSFVLNSSVVVQMPGVTYLADEFVVDDSNRGTLVGQFATMQGALAGIQVDVTQAVLAGTFSSLWGDLGGAKYAVTTIAGSFSPMIGTFSAENDVGALLVPDVVYEA